MKKPLRHAWQRFKQIGKPEYDTRRAQAGYAYLRLKYQLETLPWPKNQLARVHLHRIDDRVSPQQCVEYVMAGDFFLAHEDGQRFDPHKAWAMDCALLHTRNNPDKAAKLFVAAYENVQPLMKEWPFYQNARDARGTIMNWHDVAAGSKDYKDGEK